MVYLASAAPLPLVPFDPDNPLIWVGELAPAAQVYPAVQNITHQPHLYQVGSYQGCGCGFIYDPAEPLTAQSLAELKQYLSQHHAKQLHLYTCWAGEEWLEIENEINIAPGRIGLDLCLEDHRQLIHLK
jgi:hypothetical protein